MKRALWVLAGCLILLAAHASAQQVIEVVTFDQLLTEWYNTEGAKFSEANPGVVVQATTVAGGLQGLTDHITVRLATGDPPDLADNVLRIYYPWADQGLLVDIAPLLERSTNVSKSDIVPGLVEAKMYKGGLYNAPTSIDPFLTLFDIQAFDEAGLVDPYELSRTGNWSWATGLEAAQKLKRVSGNGDVTQWGWSPAIGTEWSWASFIAANGGRMVSQDLRTVMINQAPAVETLDWIAQLYTQYEVGRIQNFHTGDVPVAMATGNSGHLLLRYTANEAARVSAAPIPPPTPDLPSRGIMFADGPIIFKTPDQDAAWRFVEWLMGEEAQRSLADITGRVPGRLTAVRYWAELAAHYIGGAERGHLWSDAAANAELLPLGPHFTEMMSVINPAVQQILTGQAPAQTKLDEIAPQVQAILDRYYGQ